LGACSESHLFASLPPFSVRNGSASHDNGGRAPVSLVQSRCPHPGQFCAGSALVARLAILRPAILGLLVVLAGCRNLQSQSLNAEGTRAFSSGDYATAERKFQEAMAREPNRAESYYNQAVTYQQLGKINQNQQYAEKAETLYNQALDRDPDYVDAYRGLAVLLVEQSRSRDAFRLLEGWVQRSKQVDARVELARLNDEFGERQAARSLLEDALRAEPQHARALAALGRLYEQSSDNYQALELYQRSYLANRNQPQLAARITDLRGQLSGRGLTLPPAPESTAPNRIVNSPGISDWRY